MGQHKTNQTAIDHKNNIEIHSEYPSNQWENYGNCNHCRRKNFCNDPCKPNTLRAKNTLLEAVIQKLSNKFGFPLASILDKSEYSTLSDQLNKKEILLPSSEQETQELIDNIKNQQDEEYKEYFNKRYPYAIKQSETTQIIKTWEELSSIPPSEHYKIEVDLNSYNGRIRATSLDEKEYHYEYLSTHTFYEKSGDPEVLLRHGFDYILQTY